jgi:hypothetical protein
MDMRGHFVLFGFQTGGPATVVSTLWDGFGKYSMIYVTRMDGMVVWSLI